MPHSLEAEAGLLACCIIDGPTVTERCHTRGIVPESFYSAVHREVFEALVSICAYGEVDVIIVCEELRKRGSLGDFVSPAFVNALTNLVATTAHVSRFIEIVREKHLLRTVGREATALVERVFAPNATLDDIVRHVNALRKQTADARIPVPFNGRDPFSFMIPPDDDPSILLGKNRWLCRGDSAVLVSGSGMGKSSIVTQAAFHFALGREFLGIPSFVPRRSLIVQSEDSDGDVAEVVQSCRHRMGLTDEECAMIRQNVCFVRDKTNRGNNFIRALGDYLKAFPCDLLWINPLQTFASCDLTDMAEANEFLCGGLNAINSEDKFATIVVHHTTKPPTGNNVGPKQWNQVMYDMAGSHSIIDWARAIISLKATDKPGHFKLVLSKRGPRAGVTAETIDEDGKLKVHVVTEIPICHSKETFHVEGRKDPVQVIYWESDANPGPTLPPQWDNGKPGALGAHDPFIATHILDHFPVDPRSAKPHVQLAREIKEELGYKEQIYIRARDALMAQGKVGVIAGKWFRRMEKQQQHDTDSVP